jgi:2-haloacid dehalogenase
MVVFESVSHLSFDCYGTLIDWESGILDAVNGVARRRGVEAEPGRALELYAELEAAAEAGPFRPYRDVLRQVMGDLGARLGFVPTEEECSGFADSVGDWPPFADTVASLRRLHSRFRLVILSNVDDDLFARTARRLEVPFDEVITAQQLGSYKPALRNFEAMLARLGVEPSGLVHVAQSLYHDHVPAQRLGLATVWIDRPSARPGVGIAPAVEVRPDLRFTDLASFADHALGAAGA